MLFSPNGSTLTSSSSYDKTTRLWDTSSGKQISMRKDEFLPAGSTISPDGKLTAFGSGNQVCLQERNQEREADKVRWIGGQHGLLLQGADFSGCTGLSDFNKHLIQEKEGFIDVEVDDKPQGLHTQEERKSESDSDGDKL